MNLVHFGATQLIIEHFAWESGVIFLLKSGMMGEGEEEETDFGF